MTEDTQNEVLRDSIAQTRADLGDTVEALAAKADVKARTKDAVGDVTERAKAKARDVRDQALATVAVGADHVSDTASTVVDQVRADAVSVRDSLAEGDIVGAARRPLPIAALAMAAGLIGLIIYLSRRRSA